MNVAGSAIARLLMNALPMFDAARTGAFHASM